MKTEPRDSAYPASGPEEVEYGLSKREYFAAQALQGILSGFQDLYGTSSTDVDVAAELAVKAADFLVKELNA